MIAIALLAAFIVWLAARSGGHASKSSSPASAVVSEQGLRKLVTSLGEPVFWVGPVQGVRYAVEQRSTGQIYVRYLSAQMKPNATTTLTVGTYPMKNAYAKTVALGKRNGWTRVATGVGGLAAYVDSAFPRSVYFAQNGSNYQIEIYDPAPGAAAAFVRAGRALPVTQGERFGFTLAELKSEVRSRGETVYWLGQEPGVTYEYTRSPSGNVYLRYLPKGAAVGSGGAYPTVGTYPMKDAYATTERAAAGAGAVRLLVTGAVAFYHAAKPTSVFVAFKNADFQIEVYDPAPKRARSLASAVTPLR